MSSFNGPSIVISDISMASNIISVPTILLSNAGISYAVSWSGSSPIGSISVEGSNDVNVNPGINAGTWKTLPLLYNGASVLSIPLTGNSGKGLIDLVTTALYAVRLVYTRTSGTGNMTAVMFSKVV